MQHRRSGGRSALPSRRGWFGGPRSGLGRAALTLREERGQSIVEVALIVPIALVLLASSIDMGRLFFARVSIENAAREGAVFAAGNPRCDTAARAGCDDPHTADWRVRNEVRSLTGLVTTFTCLDGATPRGSVEDCDQGDAYVVTVTDEVDFVTPVLTPLFGTTMTLEASATAPVLNSAFDPSATFVPWPAPSAAPAASATAPAAPGTCTVPDLIGQRVNDAEDMWAAAGFTGTFTRTRSGNYTVVNQSLGVGGTQPCDEPITVGHS